MTKRMLGLLLGLSLLFLRCSLLDSEDDGALNLDAEIRQEMARHEIPSLAVGIVKDDHLVWTRAYGQADIEKGIPATTETMYTLMSVSKLVIAAAVMQLYEQGALDLDADLNTYLPFPVRNPFYPDRPISPRMLLTHTSGIAWPETDAEVPGVYRRYPDDAVPPLHEWLPAYLVPGGAQYVPAVWKDTAPGGQELYSNIGTALLAYLVEVVSGEPFEAYCRTHLFDPLDMPRTTYRVRDLEANLVATPYVDGYRPIPHYSHLHKPAGWLRSSVDEFSHFLLAMMNGGIYNGRRILNERTVEEILTLQNPASGVCLIWNRTIGNWYGHDGDGAGASTRVEFQRDDKVGILIFANKSSASVRAAGRIFELIRREAYRYR